MIVCHCNAVRVDDVRAEVRLGAHTVEMVMARCGAGTDCGGCRPAVVEVIADETDRSRHAIPARD